MPTDAMVIEDAYRLAETLRERDQGIIQCLCELPGAAGNRETAETLARISRRPVLHNVVAAFDSAPESHRDVLAWLDRTEREGLNLYSQAFAFRAWNEFNVLDFNAWGNIPLFRTFDLASTAEDKVRLASDPAYLARARDEYDPTAMVVAGGALESFILHRANGADAFCSDEGRQLGDIAADRGRHVTDLFFEVIASSSAQAEFRTSQATSNDPEKVSEILAHKRTIPGTSDGGAHVKFHSGGQYATDNLMWMVRDTNSISLEQMHNKLSYLPARLIGLHQRGALLEGFAADLYVYDLASLNYPHGCYDVVHDLPGNDWRRVCPAQGIEMVAVNGQTIFERNNCTGALPGQMLGNGGPFIDESLPG